MRTDRALTESVLLAVLGAVAAIVVANWGSVLDPRVLAFTAAVALLVGCSPVSFPRFHLAFCRAA